MRIEVLIFAVLFCVVEYEDGLAPKTLPASSAASAARDHSARPEPAAHASYRYPLKLSRNHRYLVDQNDKPFRIQGDSAQSLIANLTYSEAEIYFSDRAAKGFNTININLLEHKFGVKAPANRNGDTPFIKPGDFSAPNEAYFAFADSIIDLAAAKGLLVSLAAMFLGYDGGDEGWWRELNSPPNTQEVCYEFGLYLGNRYKDRGNIFWVIGADYFPPPGSVGERRLHKFMEGIKASGDRHFWAGDWKAPSISTDEHAFESVMDLNAVYTYGTQAHSGATYEQTLIAYNYSPVHPAYLKETGYENEGWAQGDPASVRKYEYWAILGGCTAGGFFGNRDIWEFATATWWSGYKFGHGPWQNALDSPGTQDMVRLGSLMDSLPWYDLAPLSIERMKNLVTQGGGTHGKLDYVQAAITTDRRVAVLYIPESAAVTLDLAEIGHPMRARWFDPTSGNNTAIGGLLSPSGRREFVTPGKNSGDANDWVLVLEAVKNPPRKK